MPSDNQLDARAGQRIEQIEIFFSWNAKDIFDILVLECLDEQLGRFHGKYLFRGDLPMA